MISFSLITALSVDDVPKLLRLGAQNYRINARHDEDYISQFGIKPGHCEYPELWLSLADLFEQTADAAQGIIESRRAAGPPTVRSRQRQRL